MAPFHSTEETEDPRIPVSILMCKAIRLEWGISISQFSPCNLEVYKLLLLSSSYERIFEA